MSRLDKIERKQKELEEKLTQKKKEKKFKLPFKAKRLFKQERKKADMVVIQYLTRKYQVIWILGRIIGGDTIVVNNKVHRLNPKAIWRHGKNMWYIVREIDREPVSNLDYNKVRARRQDTDADVPLIKAVLGAVQKPTLPGGKNTWIAIGIIAVVAVILFMFMGK